MTAALETADNGAGRTMDVFFYGLYMDSAVLRQRGVQPRSPRVAVLSGFRIALGEKAMLLRDNAATATGMLFRVTHREMEHLYSGQPAYRPEPVLARLASGENVAALTMVHLSPPVDSPLRQDYAAQYIALVRRLGFPQEHIPSPEC